MKVTKEILWSKCAVVNSSYKMLCNSMYCSLRSFPRGLLCMDNQRVLSPTQLLFNTRAYCVYCKLWLLLNYIIDWLIDWLFDWLIDIDWLIDWLITASAPSRRVHFWALWKPRGKGRYHRQLHCIVLCSWCHELRRRFFRLSHSQHWLKKKAKQPLKTATTTCLDDETR